jgi:GNAT superfamily N-acetyltransferase
MAAPHMVRSRMQLTVRKPLTALDFALYFDLRWRVLREAWTTDRESGKDEHEDNAVHLMAYVDQRLVGVGRLNFNSPTEGQIRYMAVESSFSGRGIGSTILEKLEEIARDSRSTRLVLNAREGVVPFYEKQGYSVSGAADKLFGCIVHWRMYKNLIPEAVHSGAALQRSDL